MTRIAVRADFFDASALLKVFTDEPGSKIVRAYWHSRATKYTTPFCYYEAMNALKGKWKFKQLLTTSQYLEATFQLTAWYGESSAEVKDLDFSDPVTFLDTRRLAERSGLDLSDAFQIMSVKLGYFSVLGNDSRTVLVTADATLAVVACAEGLKVWDIFNGAPPQ